MNCILCDISLPEKRSFSEILLLGKEKVISCSDCQASFEILGEETCIRCKKVTDQTICEDCCTWEKKGEIVNHTAIYRYNSAMKNYFSRYKFMGDQVLASVFSEIIQEKLKQYSDYKIVPIPVSEKGYRTRGFNQVIEFLYAATIPFEDILGKLESQAQSSKGKKERLESEQVFYLKEEISRDSKILLVDDIYTTGSTIYKVKKLLKENGVKEIISFSLAR